MVSFKDTVIDEDILDACADLIQRVVPRISAFVSTGLMTYYGGEEGGENRHRARNNRGICVDGGEGPRIDGAVVSFLGPAAIFEHRSRG